MKKRRSTSEIKNLCSGPAKLCQAFGITKSLNGQSLSFSSKIWLSKGEKIQEPRLSYSTRIGISKAKDLPWRVYVNDLEYVLSKVIT